VNALGESGKLLVHQPVLRCNARFSEEGGGGQKSEGWMAQDDMKNLEWIFQRIARSEYGF
jgi:hypothetical protein